MMRNEKTIEALNQLIELHNDRVEGYENAISETGELDLKPLFLRFARTSIDCRAKLVLEVIRLGGVPAEGIQFAAKFKRIWVNLKTALSNNNRTIILGSLEQGEDLALKAYVDILEDGHEYLDMEQLELLHEQHADLKLDHDAIKELRDAALIEHD